MEAMGRRREYRKNAEPPQARSDGEGELDERARLIRRSPGVSAVPWGDTPHGAWS